MQEQKTIRFDIFYRLRWLAAFAALAGLGALVFHVMDLLPMPFFVNFIAAPATILLFISAAFAKKLNAHSYYKNIIVGVAGGLAGTIAYDLVRLFLTSANVFNYNGFVAIYIFGGWITNTEPSTTQAAFAGWTYHFWNGISFGIFYVLTFPRRHFALGVGYGVFMELCMLGLFPFFLTVTNRSDFIALSLIGHVFYGFFLGLISQRYSKRWTT